MRKPTRAERREKRKRNQRKMVVVGKSVQLLHKLSTERANRQAKRKGTD